MTPTPFDPEAALTRFRKRRDDPASLLESYRQSENERILGLADKLRKPQGPLESLGAGLQSGAATIVTGAGGTAGMLSAAVGGKASYERSLFGKAGRKLTELGNELQPGNLPQVQDIKSPQEVSDWLMSSIGQQVPIIGITMAADALGGLAGGLTMGPAGIPVGAKAGALASSFMLEGGTQFDELVRRGVDERTAAFAAFGVGAVNSVLESAVPRVLAGRLLAWEAKPISKSILKEAGVVPNLLKAGALEAGTEAAQEVTSIGSEYLTDVQDPVQANLLRVLNSMASGAVVGSFASGATDTVNRLRQWDKDRHSQIPPGVDPAVLGGPETKPASGDVLPLPPKPGPTEVEPVPDIFAAARGSVIKTKGLQGLFQQYTGEGMLEALKEAGVAPDTALDPLVAAGVISLDETSGLYSFPEKVTGKRQDYYKSEGDDFTLDEVTKVRHFKLDSQMGVGEATIATQKDSEGNNQFVANFLGQEEVKTFKQLEAAKRYILNRDVERGMATDFKKGLATRTNPQTGETSLAPDAWLFGQRPDGTYESHIIEDKSPGGATFYRVEMPDGTNIEEADTLASAVKAARANSEFLKKTHPFFQNVIWEGEEKDAPVLAHGLDYRVRHLAQMDRYTKRKLTENPKAGTTSLWKDSQKEPSAAQVEAAAKSPFFAKFGEVQDRWVKQLAVALANSPAAVKFPALRFLPEVLKGTAIVVSDDSTSGSYTGGFHAIAAADGSALYLGFNPILHSSALDAKDQATDLWTTTVHEFAHSASHGHAKTFLRAMAEIFVALQPLKQQYEMEMTRLYAISDRDPGFSRNIRADLASVAYAGKNTVPVKLEEDSSLGPPTDERPVGFVDTFGTLSAYKAGRADKASEGGDGYSPTGEALEGEPRGDFPPASAEYRELLSRREFDTGPSASVDEQDDPSVKSIIDAVKPLTKKLGFEKTKRIEGDLQSFGKLTRNWFTLLQLGKRFKSLVPLQQYIQVVRNFWATKTQVTADADKVLKDWLHAGNETAQKVAELLFGVMEESFKLERKLSWQEIVEFASKKGLAQPDTLSLYQQVNGSLEGTLDQMEAALIADAQKQYGLLAQPAIDQVKKEMEAFRKRNYFPSARFGKHAVLVRATKQVEIDGHKYRKGSLISMTTWESENEMHEDLVAMQKEYAGYDVEVSERYLQDHEHAYLSFSPTLRDMLITKLSLNKQQISQINDMMYAIAPGRGFVKHLRRKRGIAGYSHDAMRAYSDYMQHASNHLARLSHRFEFDQTLSALILKSKEPTPDAHVIGKISEAMQKHYSNLLNPGNDYGAIRGGLFAFNFFAVPKQVLVNLTQIPVFGASYLIKKHGGAVGVADMEVAGALTRALKLSTLSMLGRAHLSAAQQTHVSRGLREGFLEESYATNVAALAENKGLSRFSKRLSPRADYLVRRTLEFGLKPFQISEEYNRRVMFLASLEIAAKKGLDAEGQYTFARDAVESTQWEYARWNRLPIATGKKAILFIFKSYLQHALHFALTGAGGVRFWLAQVMLGGILGLPFAEELLAWLGLLGTTVKQTAGLKNPKVDLETDLREGFKELGGNPDLLMHGMSRTMGLSMLSWLFGTPVPNFDLSSSISLGRVIPGALAFPALATGTKEWKDAILEILGESIGAAGTTSMNMLRAAADPGWGWSQRLRFFPSVIRNAARAYDMLTKGAYTNTQGQPLIDYDTSNPVHFAEILGQLIGLTPTKVGQSYERAAAQRETAKYYETRKELALNHYALAVGRRSKEDIDDAKAAIKTFNEMAPKEFRISGEALTRSIRARVQGQEFRQRGLPEQKRYRQLYQQMNQLYPVTQ